MSERLNVQRNRNIGPILNKNQSTKTYPKTAKVLERAKKDLNQLFITMLNDIKENVCN